MIRLIAYLVLIVLAAAGLSWIADRPGSLTVEWLGYDIRTSVFIGTIVLLITFAALALLGWLGILTFSAPKRLTRRMDQRRKRTGQEAVRRGIFAAGAGDKLGALKASAIAKKATPEEPLTLLLEAQSAQLNEDPIASVRLSSACSTRPRWPNSVSGGSTSRRKRRGRLKRPNSSLSEP